jgi:glutamate carboxypeptidase
VNDQQSMELLHQLALINSGTDNKKGVDAVGEIVSAKFMELGMKLQRFAHAHRGDLFVLESPVIRPNMPRLLISGHLDTVFEPHSGFTTLNHSQDYLHGPGVLDMKGGLVIAIRALHNLHKTIQILPANIGVVLSPDEEVGSLAHRDVLAKLYSNYDYGLILEGAGNDWELCNERKGIAILTIVCHGEAGHSGYWGNRRTNAIDVLAGHITSIVGLANLQQGTSINTGVVSGGGKINVVADRAEAQFDIRYISTKELDRIEEFVQASCKKSNSDYKLDRLFGPMNLSSKTRHLMYHLQQAGDKVGQKIVFERRGSASDGNLMSSLGLGVVDGFGAKGYDHHTKKERMLKSSLSMRAALLSATIESITKPGQNDE